MQGILAPVLTPFDRDLNPDPARLVRFCRALLDEGCDGLAPFGTTSEGNSLSLDERERLLDALLDSGLPPQKLIPGTGCCALPDTVRLSAKAAPRGGAGCITATANVNAAAIARAFRERSEERQREIDAVRAAFERLPLIAALKEAVARRTGDASWRAVRPPLIELTAEQRDRLQQGAFSA